jgi:homoserine kinase
MTDKKSISATAPPTIANIAVGFDSLGMAVKGQGDIVTASFHSKPGIHLEKITGDSGKLSLIAEDNTCSAGAVAMLKELQSRGDLGAEIGISLILEKRMALGTGLGSSASSAAAGVMAVNELLGRPFTKKELSPYALIGESKASGAVHGDNVIPALWGGAVLIRENEPLDAMELPFIEDVSILVIHPHVEVFTSESRGRLQQTITLKQHIAQAADLASFVHALHTKDIALFKRALNDRIIGPQREMDIPFFSLAKAIALSCGALNYDISGSGPSSFAFFDSDESLRLALEKLTALFHENNMEIDTHVTSLDLEGARVID